MADSKEPTGVYFLGLDLGQAADFSALVCVQQFQDSEPGANVSLWRYELRAAHRWPLRTPYSTIAVEAKEKVSKPPLPGSVLAVDCTGVGRPVAELLRNALPPAQIHDVVITGGNSYNRDGPRWHVSKIQLIGNVVALLDSGRLDLPRRIPNAETLADELKLYRMKMSAAGNETFDSPSSRHHDDLTLALALACWMGEKSPMWEPPEPLRPARFGVREKYAAQAAGSRNRARDYGKPRRGIFGR